MTATPLERRTPAEADPPPAGTLERWCLDYVQSTSLAHKLAPRDAPDPRALLFEEDAPERRLSAPGRPAQLQLVERSPAAPRPGALVRASERARLVHTFVHHELQAAELFAWAILAFPRTPRPFRAGLYRLLGEELEHLALYRAHLDTLQCAFGAHPVRDWFWQRVAGSTTPAAFVALQGLGLEGANLDHCQRWAAHFRAAGDEAGARGSSACRPTRSGTSRSPRAGSRALQRRALDARWRAALPAPLTPALLPGTTAGPRGARARASTSPSSPRWRPSRIDPRRPA